MNLFTVNPIQKSIFSDLLNSLYGININSNPCDSYYVKCIDDVQTNYQVIKVLNLNSEPNSYSILWFIQQVSVPLSKVWFESSIDTIRVYSPTVGFSVPKEFTKTKIILRELGLPITYYLNIYLNLNQMNPNFEYFTGIFQNFNQIKIFFFFLKSQPQGILFNQILLNTPMLELLTIEGKGYINDPSLFYTDLSYVNVLNPLKFTMLYSLDSFFEQCIGPCFLFPINAKYYTSYSSFKKVTIGNLSSFQISSNRYRQTPPNIDHVVGDIQESYCRLKIYLDFNELDGTVPQCILCNTISNSGYSNTIRNRFSNYDSSIIINASPHRFGGSIDIEGSFITNDVSLVLVSLNDILCSVSSFTDSKFTSSSTSSSSPSSTPSSIPSESPSSSLNSTPSELPNSSK
ncbi:hypothetical protein ACTFIZ_009265 [Dictyostelium cf. discoideum]